MIHSCTSSSEVFHPLSDVKVLNKQRLEISNMLVDVGSIEVNQTCPPKPYTDPVAMGKGNGSSLRGYSAGLFGVHAMTSIHFII